MNKFIYPGEIIGFLGGGYQSYLMAMTAKLMGFKVAILAFNKNDPALNISDIKFISKREYIPPNILRFFAKKCSAIIYENEFIDVSILEELLSYNAYIPSGYDLLSISQDRFLEKTFLDSHNINISPYATVINVDDVKKSIESIGYPAVLKPMQRILNDDNYKYIIKNKDDVNNSEKYLINGTYILESFLSVKKEISVVAVRDGNGDISLFPILENIYFKNHLSSTIMPARISDVLRKEIKRICNLIGSSINYTGVFTISFIITNNDNVYVKHINPSLTMDTNIYMNTTSFSAIEIHLRSLLGWPIGIIRTLKSGILLTIRKYQVPSIYMQSQIKKDWHFCYYPVNIDELSLFSLIGHITTVGPDIDRLIEIINATDLWKI